MPHFHISASETFINHLPHHTGMKGQPIIGKKAIARRLAEKYNLSLISAKDIITEIIQIMAENLEGGNQILLAGFGTFDLQRRKGRTVIHPTSRESLLLPERWVPAFHPCRELKERISHYQPMSDQQSQEPPIIDHSDQSSVMASESQDNAIDVTEPSG